MPEYLFNFDIHDADSNVYGEIKGLLEKNGCPVLSHPLGSTYLIQASEENVEDLCGRLEKMFSDFDMTFILSRFRKEEYCEGATIKRQIIRRIVDEALQEVKRHWGQRKHS